MTWIMRFGIGTEMVVTDDPVFIEKMKPRAMKFARGILILAIESWLKETE